MTIDFINQTPFLRTSRLFPLDQDDLVQEINKSYVDTALSVNDRTIGLFPTRIAANTGEAWFVTQNRKQQGARQVFPITGTGNINHDLAFNLISSFTRIYGTATDGTNWYPLPYVDAVAANNQISLVITPKQIQVTGGGGGGQPAITRGFVILEWIVI